MDWGPKGHPPLIPSQLSAKLSVEQWARSQSSQIIDADGLEWQLQISSRQKPAPQSVHQLTWEVTMQAKAEAGVGQLLANATLDAIADERLITLLGQRAVPFALRPKTVEAKREDDANRLASQALAEYVATIKGSSLQAIKRQLIGRYVNDLMQFTEQA